jgi:hypothetical protein
MPVGQNRLRQQGIRFFAAGAERQGDSMVRHAKFSQKIEK